MMAGEKRNGVITCRIGDVSVLLNVDSEVWPGETMSFERWRADSYATKEPDTIEWIDSFVREGDVLYDVGANIGQYGLYAAKRLKGKCRVLAFEPEALNYARLNQNVVLNGLSEIVSGYCLAITDRTGLDFFYVKSFAPGASLHTYGRPVTQCEKAFPPRNRQGMMGVSLDDLTGRFGLPFPNHIKVDVDGLEEQVVRGAARVLTDARLKSVLIEVCMYQEVAPRIKTLFFESGWTLHNAHVIDYTEGKVQNLIFVR
jgi:FkbM family methyltransferase